MSRRTCQSPVERVFRWMRRADDFRWPAGLYQTQLVCLKSINGKVVPTWNYTVVHAHGRAEAIEDPVWLERHVSELTAQQEHDQPAPWATEDAPRSYFEAMLRGIVGVRFEISRLEGKCKMSQNRIAIDRAGVVRGLRARNAAGDVELADLVERVDQA